MKGVVGINKDDGRGERFKELRKGGDGLELLTGTGQLGEYSLQGVKERSQRLLG